MESITLTITLKDNTIKDFIQSLEEKLIDICTIFKVEYSYKHGKVEVIKYDMSPITRFYDDDDIQ